MTKRIAHHDTFTIERTYAHPQRRVFRAWADADVRARWAVPAGDELEFSATDFRVGGRDVGSCGPIGDLSYALETTYYDIVNNERIVYVEKVDYEGARLGVSLMTIEFAEAPGGGTRLVLTAQIVGLETTDLLDGSKAGWSEVLDNLEAELNRAATAATAG
jgi:uncharacterized protein YndB with AHSA1/START domain